MARTYGIGLLLAFGGLHLATMPVRAEVLYRFGSTAMFDGRFGPVAKAQAKVNEALTACGKPTSLVVDGKFGRAMQNALATLADCPAIKPKLAGDEEARSGSLTTSFWDALVHEEPPTVDDRARTMVLTYEATDYTRMEWNFCQSRPKYDPAAGRGVCFSNDPRSYLTWGPNGATGGGGREVQLILAAVEAANADLIPAAFGSEAESIRRMFRIPDRDRERSLETYLCGIWADPKRREQWRTGFASVGREPIVRTKFDDLYKSANLDGGKIATFIRAYRENGLTPSEVDYAFFKDRAAQTSPSFEPIRQAIADALAADRNTEHWQVRQAIALTVRPGSQRSDRLGRDVAFFVDGAKQALSVEERQAWQARDPIKASDAGLSDNRDYTEFAPGPAIDTRIANPVSLTPAERAACPAAVLDTRRP